MNLRRRGYLQEEITGIPLSKFKVGKKVRLERKVSFSHNSSGATNKETVREISEVIDGQDGAGSPFKILRFKKMKGVYRTSGRNGVVSIWSAQRRSPKYDVLEVL